MSVDMYSCEKENDAIHAATPSIDDQSLNHKQNWN